jgi:hypothetical protein
MNPFRPHPFAPLVSEPPSTLAIAEKRVRLQEQALEQARQDLAATRARAGLPPAQATDPQAVADAIILAGKRRRGEAPMAAAPVQRAPQQSVEDPAEFARLVHAAATKARSK